MRNMIMSINLVQQVDKLLPQTQCTRCGYPSCQKYAQAIIDDGIAINQCPPGGDAVISSLAKLLEREIVPLNTDHGFIQERLIARVVEDDCIGCALCIKACPVDAIVGANKMLHTVLAVECSGCELCVPACPVDCIELYPDPLEWTDERKAKSRIRFDNHQLRRINDQKQRELRLQQQAELLKKVVNPAQVSTSDDNSVSKGDFLAQIIAKAKQNIESK